MYQKLHQAHWSNQPKTTFDGDKMWVISVDLCVLSIIFFILLTWSFVNGPVFNGVSSDKSNVRAGETHPYIAPCPRIKMFAISKSNILNFEKLKLFILHAYLR